MRNFFLIVGIFLSVGILADGHKPNEKSAKDRFANNPNHLMDFKECRELRDGIGGLLDACGHGAAGVVLREAVGKSN